MGLCKEGASRWGRAGTPQIQRLAERAKIVVSGFPDMLRCRWSGNPDAARECRIPVDFDALGR
jgi:hypothetical protein